MTLSYAKANKLITPIILVNKDYLKFFKNILKLLKVSLV